MAFPEPLLQLGTAQVGSKFQGSVFTSSHLIMLIKGNKNTDPGIKYNTSLNLTSSLSDSANPLYFPVI